MSAAAKAKKPAPKKNADAKLAQRAAKLNVQIKQEPKGPGVIGSIVEFLSAATDKKPISKAALLAKLVQRFPDRGDVALGRTLNCQVPTRIKKEKGINVQRNDEGYFVKK